MFGEQDPLRGGVLGQRKELWVREGFTEELAVLRINRAPPGGGSMESKGNGGGGAGEELGEPRVMEKNMCKVQRLETSRCVKQLQVFQYCWLEGKGRSSHEAGESGSWIRGAWSAVWMSGIWGATEGQHLMRV